MANRATATATAPQLAMRSPDVVMRLRRMGASFPTRLSFLRTLIRRLVSSGATVRRPDWSMDDNGFGDAVYTFRLGGHDYSLVAFSCPLPDEQRSDRVIAEAWDTSFVLYDGIPDKAEIERLRENAPRQEAGRFGPRDLVLSRANKSVRFFEHVVDSLARGRQPERDRLGEVGYLLRTTAVYGNGKFGIADRCVLAEREGLTGPFQAEMLTVWLIREFSHDLVEHVARRRSPETFVPLAPELRRHIGVGNSTGLGMAPFLANHPQLLNNWVFARESALARVRAKRYLDAAALDRLGDLWRQAGRHLDQWSVEDDALMARILGLRGEWAEAQAWIDPARLRVMSSPVASLLERSQFMSVDFQELLAALVIELAGAENDDLADGMAAAQEAALQPGMRLAALRRLLRDHYGWALTIAFDRPAETAQFWYVSEEKLEPRLGRRAAEAGADLELPLDIARQVQRLAADLEDEAETQTVAAFLARFPQHRHAVRRIQMAATAPYSEIRDNLLSDRCLPINMLRCKLAFFGASKFDPRSDRWTRITLFQGAPTRDEIAAGETDDCWLPVLR
ncbi:hypothetical protein N7E70_027675 (plasmid) [Aminobacter sp. NyZ550]|uniref:hypothetical protein n=1 Tax=Aminobacter sp. NyZ550 TaxID=2979870 RepID=UPI0021D5970E|nr:hypothetical protein [Aminobacter sp. NyZ550]WAX98380.1 hypothetical protein N7E70_027675 [Aminobacter sp. NyZ550]